MLHLEQPSTSDNCEGPILVDINPAPTKGACNYEQPPTSDSCEGSTLVDYPSEEKTKINVGTQCCVGARYRITPSVSTETDVKTYAEIGIQVNIDTGNNGAKDIQKPLHKFPQRNQKVKMISLPAKGNLLYFLYEEVYPSDEEPLPSPIPPIDDGDDDNDDEDYNASDKEGSVLRNSDDEGELQSPYEESPYEEQKFIVFEPCLKKLLKFCPKCASVISESKMTKCGSMLSVKIRCINNHDDYCWTSQPMIKNTAAGNLLTSAAILFSGNTFSRIAQFASFLKLKFFSHSTFYNIQNKFLLIRWLIRPGLKIDPLF